MVGARWSCAAAAVPGICKHPGTGHWKSRLWFCRKGFSGVLGNLLQQLAGRMSLHTSRRRGSVPARRITDTSRKAEIKLREPTGTLSPSVCIRTSRRTKASWIYLISVQKQETAPPFAKAEAERHGSHLSHREKGRGKEQTAPFLLSRSVSERRCISHFVPGIFLSLSPGQVLENSEKISGLRPDRLRPLLTPISSRRSRGGDCYKQQGRGASPKHPGDFKGGLWFNFSLGLGQCHLI